MKRIFPATAGASLIAGAASVVAFALLPGCIVPGVGEMDSSVGENGSFEIVRSGLPVNWVIGRQALKDGAAEYSFDTSDAVDGVQSLKLIVHRVDEGPWRVPWLFQSREAEPSATYAVSFWLKSTACVVEMEIRNEGNDPLFGLSEAEKQDYAAHPPIKRIIGGGETDTEKWRQFRYVYTTPETDGSLRFELRIMRPCTLWIDDVRIARVEGEPTSKPRVRF